MVSRIVAESQGVVAEQISERVTKAATEAIMGKVSRMISDQLSKGLASLQDKLGQPPSIPGVSVRLDPTPPGTGPVPAPFIDTSPGGPGYGVTQSVGELRNPHLHATGSAQGWGRSRVTGRAVPAAVGNAPPPSTDLPEWIRRGRGGPQRAPPYVGDSLPVPRVGGMRPTLTPAVDDPMDVDSQPDTEIFGSADDLQSSVRSLGPQTRQPAPAVAAAGGVAWADRRRDSLDYQSPLGREYPNPPSSTYSMPASTFSEEEQRPESGGSSAPAARFPSDWPGLLRRMASATDVPLEEAQPEEAVGYRRAGAPQPSERPPGMGIDQITVNAFRELGDKSSRGKMYRTDRELGQLRLTENLYGAFVKPLRLPETLTTTPGTLGARIGQLKKSADFVSWSKSEEMARAGLRATEALSLVNQYLDKAQDTVVTMSDTEYETAFPEQDLADAVVAQRACLDLATRQLVRCAVHATQERRKLTVSSLATGDKGLDEHLLKAPAFNLASPDLFSGEYDSRVAEAADNVARQQLLQSAQTKPAAYMQRKTAPSKKSRKQDSAAGKQQSGSGPGQAAARPGDTGQLSKSQSKRQKRKLLKERQASRKAQGQGQGGRGGGGAPLPRSLRPVADQGFDLCQPVGGLLMGFVARWQQITQDRFVLQTIAEGYRIEFTGP